MGCEVQGATLAPQGTVPEEMSRSLESSVMSWINSGREGRLAGKTYCAMGLDEPNFAARSQSREMLQFGVFTHSNQVEYGAEVLPLPPILEQLLDDLIEQGVLTADERPDTCTVNVYSQTQWVPPHIDNPKFARPFFVLSLASPHWMLMGRDMRCEDKDTAIVQWKDKVQPLFSKSIERGEFATQLCSVTGEGSCCFDKDRPFMEAVSTVFPGVEHAYYLPAGSVLRMSGEAADEYLHAVPPVTSEQRISLVLRRLDPLKDLRKQFQEERQARVQAKIDRKRADKARKMEEKAKLKAAQSSKQSST